MSEVEVDNFPDVGSFLKFCITPGCIHYSDPSKEQVKKAIFLVRQLIGLIFGIAAGFNHFTGFPVMIVFLLSSVGFTHFYSFKFLKIDEEKVENTEIYMEALPLSFAIFILSWTITHTTFM